MTTTPTVWKSPFLVNTGNTTGIQSQSVTAGLSNGTFVTLWTDDTFTTDNPDPSDIRAQIYDLLGNRIDVSFVANPDHADLDDTPVVTALDDGGFVIAYHTKENASGWSFINYARYDASGDLVADDLVTFTTNFGGGEVLGPSLTTLSNGDYAFAWTFNEGSFTAVNGQSYDSVTNLPQDELNVGRGDKNESAFDGEIAGLSNGNTASIYVDEDEQGLSVFGVNYRLVNGSTGAIIGSDVEIANIGSDPNVAALTGGGFVSVWVDGDNDILAQVRTNSGGLTHATFTVAGGTESRSSPDVVGLQDGGFFIAWRNVADDTINGKRFDAAGIAVGAAFVIDHAGRNPELSVMDDGRILVTYGKSNNVYEAILDPRDGVISGTSGGDEIAARLGSTTVDAGDGNDRIEGMDGHDSLSGGVGLDTINGNAGADTLLGGLGIDTLNGGGGADVLFGGLATDFVNGGVGNDIIKLLEGEAGDHVDGGDGTDLLDLSGLTSTTDATVDLAAGSWQTTFTPLVTIAAIENVTGGTGEDALTGSGSNNALDGRGGFDTIYGGLGNDTIAGGNGHDQLYGNGVLTVARADNDSITGGAGNDTIDGGIGNDTLDGGVGRDSMIGGSGADSMAGGDDRDLIEGGSGVDTISGGGADDTIYAMDQANPDGSADGDTLLGEDGDDFLRGSAGDDDIKGDNGNDTVDGGGGNDSINGGENDDSLTGGADNDTLNGGTHDDTMAGGSGDDTYTVGEAGDVVIEQANEGADLVRTELTYTLGANLENLVLNGTADVNGAGNGARNSLTGNDGDNSLNGAGDQDTMTGGNGNDTYFYGTVGDTAIEQANQGTDTIRASVSASLSANVERLLLIGTDAIDGAGNQLDNTLTGNTADNHLDGLRGSDTLNGGSGADTYAFTTALGANNIDTIIAYSIADDVIELQNAVFIGLAPGVLDADAFVIGAAAADAEDRILYNSATGAILFDADGNGAAAAQQFATTDANLAMTNAEFEVI